jgi:ABC-type maltose transport system permease subunit
MVRLHRGHALFFLVFHQDLIPGIRLQIIDAIDDTVGLFMGPLIYISDMEKYTNSIYLRMSMDGDVGFQWNRILAMSLISIIPSLIVFFCAQDSFIDGIAAGGVKG